MAARARIARTDSADAPRRGGVSMFRARTATPHPGRVHAVAGAQRPVDGGYQRAYRLPMMPMLGFAPMTEFSWLGFGIMAVGIVFAVLGFAIIRRIFRDPDEGPDNWRFRRRR